MMILRAAFLVLLTFFLGGCLTQRTIKNGDQVVAQGYVVKPPLAPVVPQ